MVNPDFAGSGRAHVFDKSDLTELSVTAVFGLPWRKVMCSHSRGDTLRLRLQGKGQCRVEQQDFRTQGKIC